MTYSIKIMLSGLSGAGKTTTLKILVKNAHLLGEQKRAPTKFEQEAWHLATEELVSTSMYTNFGILIVTPNYETQEFIFHHEPNYNPQENDVILNLFDTCGQEIFYPLRQATAIGVQGILFFIDAALLQLRLDFSNVQKIINGFEELRVFLGDELEKIPMVFLCNKQDLIKTDHGKAGFIKKTIAFYDSMFEKYPFMNASAVEGWGAQDALKVLLMDIAKRLGWI
ncbi:MAG TPA: ADP-ribosylation factor-like protein [Candidatus Deferrimicrobium sp.]|nr:ADP-ribosylation factor-like protein [Candidatus Deferrimicrobium sp.]